jgi:hypothetical protein
MNSDAVLSAELSFRGNCAPPENNEESVSWHVADQESVLIGTIPKLEEDFFAAPKASEEEPAHRQDDMEPDDLINQADLPPSAMCDGHDKQPCAESSQQYEDSVPFEAVPTDYCDSFTKTFEETDVPQADIDPLSPLEVLLKANPPCSIESLVDDDLILLEFHYGNPRLLERLSAPEGLRVLLEHVTQVPRHIESDAEAADRTLRRRPWIASELLTNGDSSFFDAFWGPEGAELLDVAMAFLDRVPDPPTSTVLSSYFCSCMTTLLERGTAEVARHLRQRDPGELFECFLRRLESRSFAELLALIACATLPEYRVFPVQDLVLRFISNFDRRDLGADVLEHIVLILEVLLARASTGMVIDSDQLVLQFTDPEVVARLVDQALRGCTVDGCSASSAAAASMLAITVFHTFTLSPDPLLPTRSPEFRPLPLSPRPSSSFGRPQPPPPPPAAPPPPLLDSELEHVSDSPEKRDEDLEDRGFPSPESAVEDLDFCCQSNSDAEDILIREVCSQVPRLCEVFDIALQRQAQHPFSIPHAGATTLEVITLLALMAQTGRSEVFEVIHDAEVLPRCIEVIFQFPWNNLLHNAVLSFVRELAKGQRPAVKTIFPLLDREDLLERITTEVKYDVEVRSGTGKVQRAGYASHLRHISKELNSFSEHNTEVQFVLTSTAGWEDVLQDADDVAKSVLMENDVSQEADLIDTDLIQSDLNEPELLELRKALSDIGSAVRPECDAEHDSGSQVTPVANIVEE